MEKDANFIEMIVKELVSKPEVVKVERTVDEMGVLLTLKVDSEDIGTVVGKQGQTAKAMRTLLRIVGAKNKVRANLKIDEPNKKFNTPREYSGAVDVSKI